MIISSIPQAYSKANFTKKQAGFGVKVKTYDLVRMASGLPDPDGHVSWRVGHAIIPAGKTPTEGESAIQRHLNNVSEALRNVCKRAKEELNPPAASPDPGDAELYEPVVDAWAREQVKKIGIDEMDIPEITEGLRDVAHRGSSGAMMPDYVKRKLN